jgi:hypothetical protein
MVGNNFLVERDEQIRGQRRNDLVSTDLLSNNKKRFYHKIKTGGAKSQALKFHFMCILKCVV